MENNQIRIKLNTHFWESKENDFRGIKGNSNKKHPGLHSIVSMTTKKYFANIESEPKLAALLDGIHFEKCLIVETRIRKSAASTEFFPHLFD